MMASNQPALKSMIYIEESKYTIIPKIDNKSQVLVILPLVLDNHRQF